ncbi:hypothetical protein TWF694_010152 [Orbilia ellipsospora]|uniref:Uncharacterized protein n=1 Tax=Orbilia ellipsospora TaxID=2528407 RepID=A0AAV9X9H0_9PEZI
MGFFDTVVLTLALAATSLAAPTSAVLSHKGRVISPMHFTGSVTPGGPVLDLQGSVQELIPQILKLDPKWTPPSGWSPNKAAAVKRYFHGDPNCDVPGDPAPEQELEREVIPYLQNLGTGNCGAYAYTCSRVSCAWGAAVFLCNQTGAEIHVSCERIGDAAQHIVDWCDTRIGTTPFYEAKGVWPDTTGYFIEVVMDDC